MINIQAVWCFIGLPSTSHIPVGASRGEDSKDSVLSDIHQFVIPKFILVQNVLNVDDRSNAAISSLE